MVSIKVEDGKLTLTCENTNSKEGGSENNLEIGENGIGLLNAKKRLNLMYPERHSLRITENSKTYNVELVIDL